MEGRKGIRKREREETGGKGERKGGRYIKKGGANT